MATSPRLDSPLPLLQEVTETAKRLTLLRRDLWLLDAELKTKRELKRAGYVVGAAASAFFLLLFTFGWLTMALFDAGWSPVAVALVSFLFFGAVAGVLLYLAKNVGSEKRERRHHSLEANQ